MQKIVSTIYLFLFIILILTFQPTESIAKKKSQDKVKYNEMGWLFISPEGKWGLTRAKALEVIKKEVGMNLETIVYDSENIALLGNMVFVIEKRVIPFFITFFCEFKSQKLNGLTVMWNSDEISAADTAFIWNSLIKLAQDKFNAPKNYIVMGYSTEKNSKVIPFGNDFEEGIQFYSISWIYKDIASEMNVVKKINGEKRESIITLRHKKK